MLLNFRKVRIPTNCPTACSLSFFSISIYLFHWMVYVQSELPGSVRWWWSCTPSPPTHWTCSTRLSSTSVSMLLGTHLSDWKQWKYSWRTSPSDVIFLRKNSWKQSFCELLDRVKGQQLALFLWSLLNLTTIYLMGHEPAWKGYKKWFNNSTSFL